MIRSSLFLLIASLSVSISHAQSDEIKTTHEALKAFYRSTQGNYGGSSNWTGWDTTTVPTRMEDFNQWYGLTISGGKLTEIKLKSNSLYGKLPPELGNLTSLKILDLSENSIGGKLPPELGNLINLEKLDLSNNDFSGWLPPPFKNLAKLRILDLSSNNFDGLIPPSIGNLIKLEKLELSYNQFTGGIPPEFGNLTNLKTLFIKHYSRFGGIAGDGSLGGKIPAELGKLTSLDSLHISRNSVVGKIPPEMGNLTNLKYLNLSQNRIEGKIPPEMGNLTNLKYLNLSQNRIEGKIPPEMGNLTSLGSLHLYVNRLSGGIPPELGRLSDLIYLALSNNPLGGELPSELEKLANLKFLYLVNNSLEGWLPPSLGKLANLEELYLNNNKLEGNLPSELGNLINLKELSIFSNNFEGAIPRSFLHLKNLEVFEAYSNDLCSPRIYELQFWLGENFSGVNYNACPGAFFFDDIIEDQSYVQSQEISQLTLPEATTATESITIDYSLTPTLPQGLKFDPSTRTISGIPTQSSPATTYSYRSHDSNNFRDSLRFSLKVAAYVSAEQETVPDEFMVHPNYPNPFHNSTSLVFDLPYPAQVGIEVLDVTGRQVFMKPPAHFSAGREKEIQLSGFKFPSGTYLYRLTATSSEGRSVHVGRFVRIR